MKKKRKSLKIILRRENGITLITLVITIIILLILASVTLNVVLGEGGLIEKAKIAKNMTEESARKQQEELNNLMEEYANIMADDGNITEPIDISIKESHTTESITIEVETSSEEEMTYKYYINGKLESTRNEPTYTTNITLENKDPYIPSAFTHTEGTVEEGYVIQDTSIGNEFVWIPVASGIYEVYVEVEASDGNTGKSDEMTIEISELTREIDGITYDKWTENEGDITDEKSVAYFKHSVVTNSGFYIGRYEMGMPGQQSGDAPVLDFTNEARNISGVPVCVAKVMPWTNIDWSTAKANLESMYRGEVESAMMNSYARTTTIKWLKDYQYLNTVENSWQDNNFYFNGYYYYSGELGKTNGYENPYDINDGGATQEGVMIETGADVLNNTHTGPIYDLGGNLSEWTTEKRIDGKGYRASGGNYSRDPLGYGIIDDNNSLYIAEKTGSIEISSRPILYK